MSPEFGATATLFPIDDETLAYLRLTGRSAERVDLVERYARAQGLWREPGRRARLRRAARARPRDASTRRSPGRAGRRTGSLPARNFRRTSAAAVPERPVARPADASRSVADSVPASTDEGGDRPAPTGRTAASADRDRLAGQARRSGTGSVAIAAITSCTNTSNPTVMVGAGLLARNAVARGLRVGPTVKTSLAPGLEGRDRLSRGGRADGARSRRSASPWPATAARPASATPARSTRRSRGAIEANDLVVAAVLSGNRNFEGRIHPLARASYLASPPLVVAFALAGRVDIDLTTRAARHRIATGGRSSSPTSGRRPTRSGRSSPTRSTRSCSGGPTRPSSRATTAGGRCRSRPATATPGRTARPTSPSRRSSTASAPSRRRSATSTGRASWPSSATRSRPTTSRRPARSPPWSPAGQWLQAHGVGPLEFNSYGARRGHHEVMMRGTFGNIRLRNRLVEGKEGPYTVHLPDGEEGSSTTSAMRYARRGRAAARSSPVASTARARRATGRPRARRCSGSGSSSPRASSGSIARTWSGWASCRSSSGPARAPRRSA